MEIAPEPTYAPQLDRATVLAEVRVITQPRLAVPLMSDTVQRTETVAGMLRSLLKETQDDNREAVRVMRRLGARLLDEAPLGEVSPYTAWQHLVNLARCTEAFLDVEGRAR
ncbi:hypothetical protein [Streptomyces sp. KR55]|uniref:hypothetical protein n=1 Tax=Streptomyces sp. KR55 TaxID=3457425 RepID=UPI003FD66A97